MSTERVITVSPTVAKRALAALNGEKREPREFPAWAPPNLVRAYHNGSFAARVEIMGALASHDDMQAVWECLGRRSATYEKHRRGGASAHAFTSYDVSLYLECQKALDQWETTPKLTRSQTRRLHKKISSMALELAGHIALVREDRIEESVMDAVSEDSRADLWCRVDSVVQHALLTEASLQDSPMDSDALEYALNEALPTLAGVLLRVNEVAGELARSAPGLEQPRSPMAGPRFVARRLSRYFRQHYELPLHEHVARIVSVLFGCAMDKDRVRQLVSRGKKR